MKKVVFLLSVIMFALIIGCKQKVEPVAPPPPPPPPPPQKISEMEFLLSINGRPEVKNLKVGDSLVISIDPGNVSSPSAQSVVVKPFNADLNYYELRTLLKKIPLTVVWDTKQGSQLLIIDYFDFRDNYTSSDEFRILEPMPAYYLRAGTKEYWVGKEGKFWKTW